MLPNAVDVARFAVDDSPPPRNRNVLFVGNLIKRKGIDVLLRATANLVAEFPDMRLTIVGKGPEKASLQNLAADLGVSTSVSFIGEVDDDTLASLYHSATIVVLPSYSEVFGVVILEAFAANRSVVATSTVGAISVITDRVSGRIVPIGDSEGIADAIADLFSNYEAAVEMAGVGHQLAVSKYSVEAVTESLEWLYRSESLSPQN